MFKKIFVTTMLVAISSICLGAAPNNQKLNNDKAVAVVKNEIYNYKNLTKLQKAQMLVSHKSVEDETKTRRDAYMNGKTIKSVPDKSKSASLKKLPSAPKKITKAAADSSTIHELSFKERLKAKFGLDLTKSKANQYLKKGTSLSLEQAPKQRKESSSKRIAKPVPKNIANKVADNSKVKELQKQLQETRTREAQLQKENNAMKRELKKSISVMQKLKNVK